MCGQMRRSSTSRLPSSGAGRLEFAVGARFPLSEAGAALVRAVAGRGGAVALEM